MPRKKPEHIDGQFSIFDPNPETGLAPDTPYPVTYGPEGSYVNVARRAVLLENSLTALGKRNQRLGFDVASHTKPHSTPIWGRYEDLTPLVIEGAQRNVENFLDVAKRDFWEATGFAALRALEGRSDVAHISSNEIDARGRKMWRDFSHAYGDPKVKIQRDKYKRQLRKVIRRSKSQDQKLAA